MVVSQRPFDPYQAGAEVYRAYRAGGWAARPTDNPADKTMNADKVLQVAPKEFYDAYAKYTELSLDGPVSAGKKIMYKCMAAETLEEVIEKLTGPIQVFDLNEAIPRYMIVFGFSATGDPSAMMRTEVSKVIQASMHTTDYLTFDEEDNDAMSMDVPFPSVWIGSEVLRSVVCSTTLLTTSQVNIHSVLYLPPSQSLSRSRSSIPHLACIFRSCIRSQEARKIYSANGWGSRSSLSCHEAP
jgi:hypothetical protein